MPLRYFPVVFRSLLGFRKDDSVPCLKGVHVLDRRVVFLDIVEELGIAVAINLLRQSKEVLALLNCPDDGKGALGEVIHLL